MISSLLLAIVTLASQPTSTHGPLPAGIDVILASDQHAQIIQLSRGAAIATNGNWQYMCAWQWNGPELPSMHGSTDGEVWIAASNGLQIYNMEENVVRASDNSALTAAVVRSMSGNNEQTLALVGFGTDAYVWRLDVKETKPLVKVPNARSMVALSNGFAVVTSTDDNATIYKYDQKGATSSPAIELNEKLPGALSIRSANDEIYIVSRHNDQSRLYKINGASVNELIQSNSPIHGPVITSDGVKLLIVDQTLQHLENGQITAMDTPKTLTCLRKINTQVYACVEPNIFTVNANGTLGNIVFDLQTIKPPNYEKLNLEQKTGCEIDWLDFAVDAELPLSEDDEPTSDVISSTVKQSAACATSRLPQCNLWPWVLFALFSLKLRNYGLGDGSGAMNSRRKIVRIRSRLT